MPDGQYLYRLAGYEGTYRAGQVRRMMADSAESLAGFADIETSQHLTTAGR